MTRDEAMDLIGELHEACKNNSSPEAEEIAILNVSLAYLLCRIDTPEDSADYIKKRIADNKAKNPATENI